MFIDIYTTLLFLATCSVAIYFIGDLYNLWEYKNTGTCSGCPDISSVPTGFLQLAYTTSADHLINPGRGFYIHTETNSIAAHAPLTISELDNYRQNDGISMVFRMFVLEAFVDSAISVDYLTKIRADLDTVKQVGWTAVIRFSYTTTSVTVTPYGDATKARMLEHIAQLQPILHEYEGVISAVQAGFIGIWGEWYYTTHFGDPNEPDTGAGSYHGISAEHWMDREDVLTALIDATPISTQVQVRTPRYKRHIWDSTATTYSDVTQETRKSRTGNHNDCFLASPTDFGTYIDLADEYPYLQSDTQFCVMGGETCAVTDDVNAVDRYKCPTAEEELAKFHWSFLNQIYHPDVLNSWKTDNCYNRIHRNLGYRLALVSAILPTSARVGGELCYNIVITNHGYAAPYKQMVIRLILKSQAVSGEMYSIVLNGYDVRTWQPATDAVIEGTFQVPSTLPLGEYDMYLAISDNVLTDVSDYYVLLANDGVPVVAEGMNSLQHSVQILKKSGQGSSCDPLTPWTGPTPSGKSRLFTPA